MGGRLRGRFWSAKPQGVEGLKSPYCQQDGAGRDENASYPRFRAAEGEVNWGWERWVEIVLGLRRSDRRRLIV
jgi:hypothetical protein